MKSNSKEFKTLQTEWYDKLAKSGFDNIERPDGKLRKTGGVAYFKDCFDKYGHQVFQAKENYYRIAGYFLNEFAFESEKQRIIWELHTEGKSIRDIKILLKNNGMDTYKDGIEKTIKNLRKEMIGYYGTKYNR